MAQLADSSLSEEKRLEVANDMCRLDKCCVDPLFGWPVLQAIQQEGGVTHDTIISGPLASDIQASMRGKTSNIEIELNFARAACCRQSMHGRAHNIPSMVAKHVSAEIKLGHSRYLRKHGVHRKQKQGRGSIEG